MVAGIVLAVLPLSVSAPLARVSSTVPAVSAQSSFIIKLSRNGICHPPTGAFYYKTKYFKPYKSMSACIAAGGRPSKR